MTTATAKPPLLLRQLSPAQLQVLDAVHAILVGFLCLLAAAESPEPPATGWREPGWVTAAAAVLLGLPTLLRRRRPLTAAAVAVTVAAACVVSGVVPDYAAAGPLVAVGMVLYIVGADVGGRRSPATMAAAVAVTMGALAVASRSQFGPGAAAGAAFCALVLTSSWALGWTVRERRAQAARALDQAMARATDEERLRIARELHDIVAHSMSLIAVKATVANHVADDRPDEVRAALRVIEATSRAALLEMRRTIGSLRTADTGPEPEHHDLTSLFEAARSAGLPVEVFHGGAEETPPELATAVFRIVQEALTNVLKHSAATRCRVIINGRGDGVEVEVWDDGPAGTPDEALAGTPDEAPAGTPGGTPADDGHGLVGMRERVELYGGELYAGPDPGAGGWVVRARLEAVR